MAASATTSSSTMMMECSLCLSGFKKPKCLPCIHTFCLECLEEYVDKNDSPDELPCPLCRERFNIPAQGVSGLRDNFFLLSMQEVALTNESKISANTKKSVICDLCREELEESCCPVAQKYCAECDQNMCSSCLSAHGKMRATRSHVAVLLSEMDGSETASSFSRPRFCDKHRNDSLRLYCITCEVPVCIVCFAVEHQGQGHQCEEITDTADKFRGQFQSKISQLEECFPMFGTMLQKLKSMEASAQKKSEENESGIRKKCNEIRRALDLYEEELLGESKKHANAILNEITSQVSEVESLNMELEKLKEYLKKMNKIGSHSDVACSGKQLLERAERLMTASKNSTLKQDASVKQVKFIPYTGNTFDKSKIGLIVAGAATMLPMEGSQQRSLPPPPMGRNQVRPLNGMLRPGQSVTIFHGARPGMRGAMTGMPMPYMPPYMPGSYMPREPPAQYKFYPAPRNRSTQMMTSQQQRRQVVHVTGEEPLTANMLSEAPPQEQKQMLGERLFPLIHSMYPDLAGKITGMLLEIDNSELLHMLESKESLKAKVEESAASLHAHQVKEAAGADSD